MMTLFRCGSITIVSFLLFSFWQIQYNKLTRDEKKDGWQLLFDGKSTRGWHIFQKPETLNPQWKVENGTLTLTNKGGGDLVSDQEYENFELSLEWKISKNGNSGIFFNVSENAEFNAPWKTGPEMQILDDDGHPDGKIPTHTSGANYDFSIPLVKSVRAVGEWNHVRIVVNQGNVTYYLNGQVTAKFELWTPEWETAKRATKFANMSEFGQIKKGHIVLQDHGDPVWFRNIKIKPF